MEINDNFKGQLCWHCEKPIYGFGILADAPGGGCTSYHAACYQEKQSPDVPRVTFEEINTRGDLCSLAKIVGKKITDVEGFIVDREGSVNFQLDRIVFEDETLLFLGDYSCVISYDTQPNFDEVTLIRLFEESRE